MTDRLKRGVSVSVYNNDGRILAVTNRRWGGFTLPGGKVEEGEDPVEAAFRELEEETGLKAIAMKFLGNSMFDNPLTDDAPFIISHFEAVTNYMSPKQVEEGTRPFWVEAHDLFRGEESIFAEHYRNIEGLGVIRGRGGKIVLD